MNLNDSPNEACKHAFGNVQVYMTQIMHLESYFNRKIKIE